MPGCVVEIKEESSDEIYPGQYGQCTENMTVDR
jgi:hypothetical protein